MQVLVSTAVDTLLQGQQELDFIQDNNTTAKRENEICS